MLSTLFHYEEDLEISSWIYKQYGKLLKERLESFPDYPNTNKLYEIMDILEKIKYERELKLHNECIDKGVIENKLQGYSQKQLA